MRYRIYCGSYPLSHNREELLLDTQEGDINELLAAARASLGVNRAGSLNFTLIKGHRLYDDIALMYTVLEIWDGEERIWTGRPISIKTDKQGQKAVEGEGNLNYLMDVPDTMTNPEQMVKHYKIGENGAVTLEFTEQTVEGEGNGLYQHLWSGSEWETLYQSEFGDVFFVEWDGDLYELFLNELDEWYGDPVRLHRVGFIGSMNLYDESYAKTTDDPGAGVPFYVENSGIYTKSTEGTHNVRIYRRDPLTVQQMFNLMFTDNSAYNGYASPARHLYRGTCDVVGKMIYDPRIDTTCLDTLHAWQEKFGGYIYTSYDAATGHWLINYTQSAGADRDDVPISYGLNLTDIAIDEAGEGLITAIAGVGVDDEEETRFTLAGGWTPTTPRTGYTIDSGTGYVKLDAAQSAFGWIRKQREYIIPHNSANKYQALYDAVCDDLEAAQTVKQSVRLSAVDARLLGENAGRPNTGDNYPVNAAPYGVNGDRMMLTDMEIDFLKPGAGSMALGGERKAISQMIK